MKVDISKCIGCGICVPFCPAKAISVVDRKAYINQDKCLECGNCIRKRTVKCPKDAIYEPEETRQYPRNYRRFFSDPSVKTPSGLPGRGTEEVKTNDVTGRVCRGELGIAIEMGRPVLGTSLKDVEIVSKKLASPSLGFILCSKKSTVNFFWLRTMKKIECDLGLSGVTFFSFLRSHLPMP